jgi:hypothetical protein
MIHPLFIQFLLCLVCHDLSTDHNPEEKLIPTTVACAIGPSVNTFSAELIFPCKPKFLQFVSISSNKIHSKLNISHILLALKFVK